MALALLSLLGVAACSSQRDAYEKAADLTGGDPYAGQQKLRRFGCYACHTIPGVPGADAVVGPSLKGIATRQLIAGTLPNTPANLTRWIEDPRSIAPHTRMPALGVSEQDSRDMAAYLYTLR